VKRRRSSAGAFFRRFEGALPSPLILHTSVLAMTTANWPAIQIHAKSGAEAIAALKTEDYREVAFPKSGA